MVDNNVANLSGVVANNIGNKIGGYVVVDNVANSGDVGENLNYFQVHFVTRPRKVGA